MVCARWKKNRAISREISGVLFLKAVPLTKLFAPDDLYHSSTVCIQHIVEPLDMREAVLSAEAGLKRSKCRGYLSYVIVEEADTPDGYDTLFSVFILRYLGELISLGG